MSDILNFPVVPSYSVPRLITWYKNRLLDYNRHLRQLEEDKEEKIQKLEDSIQDQEDRAESSLIRAEETRDRKLELTQSRVQKASIRAEFRRTRLKIKRSKRKPEKIAGNTKSFRQKMYTVSSWASKYRQKTVYYRKINRYGRRFESVNLPISYPTEDLSEYIPFQSNKCATDWINADDPENAQQVEVCVE